MWGSGGRARDVDGCSLTGTLATEEELGIEDGVVGVAMDEVDRRDAAMVRRRCDSVLRVAEVIQARRVQHGKRVAQKTVNIPGHPFVLHQSSSSSTKHCRHKNAPRASPANANSRSSLLWVHNAASASAEARLKSSSTGITSACSRSRCRTHVSLVCVSHFSCCSQKLMRGQSVGVQLRPNQDGMTGL